MGVFGSNDDFRGGSSLIPGVRGTKISMSSGFCAAKTGNDTGLKTKL